MQMQQSMQTLQGAGLFSPGAGAGGANPNPMMGGMGGMGNMGANPYANPFGNPFANPYANPFAPPPAAAGGLNFNSLFIAPPSSIGAGMFLCSVSGFYLAFSLFSCVYGEQRPF